MSDGEDKMFQYCNDNVFTANILTKYIHWFLIPAVLILTVLSFLEKRKSIKPGFLGGRPALVRPLGFLDEPSNRWGVMFVFGSVTGNIIQITQKTLSDELDWPIWAKIFLVYILCLETSVICYPLFACMTSRHKLVGALTGLLYSIGWFVIELFRSIQIGRCYVKYTDPDDQVKLCRRFHLTYVKHLVNKNYRKESKDRTWKQTIQSKIMRPVPGFRFPITILITIFMSSVMLYMVGLYCAMFMEIEAKLYFTDFVDLLQAANVVATIITIMCGIRNIYLFLMNYRRDMLLLYKGDRSFVPNTVQTPSQNVYMAQGMRYIGTSITGMLWGTVFCFLLVYVPLALMMVTIKLLGQREKLDDMWKQFQWLIYPACMVVIFKLQVFLIGRFFIQPKLGVEDKYRPLAVDNRNAYDVFSFFMIFLNASIGLFAFLKRILVGAFLGVFLIPRMDRSLLMRGYEAMDKCYVNYIGMLMVDVSHNHPVMRVFCFLVKSDVENRRDRKPLRSAVENAEYGNLSFSEHIPTLTRNSRAKRRWWLAFTLIRNPSIVATRVRESKNESPRGATVEVTDITWSDKTTNVDQDQSADTWGFSITCCKKYKFKIPPNIVTNFIALIVLLSVLVIYTGLPLLINDIMEEAAREL